MENNYTYRKDETKYIKKNKGKRKLTLWGKGVVALATALVVTYVAHNADIAIKANNYAEDISNIGSISQVYQRDNDSYIIGNDAEKMAEVAEETIQKSVHGIENYSENQDFNAQVAIDAVSQGVSGHVIIAAHYHEADRANGYEDEIPTMDELFRSLHALLYGHEEEYSEELLAVLNYPDFRSYLEAYDKTPKEYHDLVPDLLATAKKYGSTSEQVQECLDRHGLTHGSGGRI